MNKKYFQHQNHTAKTRGMTFIEVLVALFILVTGILGAVAMQASAKKGSFDAMQRSVASALAQDIIERMRSNDATNLAAYAGTDYGETLNEVPSKRCRPAAGADPLTGACTANEMVLNDQYEWELLLMGGDVINGSSNLAGLVGVRGCIIQANNAVTVVISWDGRNEMTDAKKHSCGVASDKRRQVVVEAFVN